MAFIHTAAKPPRDVRIQQEIHGTAVHQPPGPRLVFSFKLLKMTCPLGVLFVLACLGILNDTFFSVKVPDNRPRQSCSEQSRTSTSTAGSGNTQDPRKKTSELARPFYLSTFTWVY